ncbi:hypothetical protein BKA93DRAFT_171489 [Sparassis latifolia]|uniref:Mid2 domain-containing protein n=1 Tax=Sparassis crispa TaxID=139825 RepID=A0A401G796_9APHY|nr:hypothetical protein SCP_0109050 [Sparassis crispa]GBE78023.1 hypothetical protein SCP_0109050 [Sparassis crispa]
MSRHFVLLPTLILLSISSPVVAANFTFSYGTPTQCGNFPFSWTGGTAPFELTLIPVFGRPQVIQIPSSSFSNGRGSYQAQLPLAENQQFLATMSDANGFASGGTSDILTVGPPPNGAQCNTTAPAVDFFYDTNSALVQCRTYTFNNYVGAVLPVTVTGVIPGGVSFILNAPAGATSFDWTTNVASGTSIVFFMADSKGRQGGSTQVDVVGLSDNASCLTGSYPSSVANTPSATASASSSSSSSASSTNTADSATSNHSSVSGGTIAAAAIGSLLALVVIVLVIFFLLRRRRRARTGEYPDENFYAFRPKRADQPVDLAHDSADNSPEPVVQPYPFYAASDAAIRPSSTTSHSNLLRPSTQYDSDVFPMQNPFSTASVLQRDSQMDAESVITEGLRGEPTGAIFSHGQGSGSSLGTRSKAAIAGVSGYAAPARFILHTDAEEVIELPPQYSDLRPPPSFSGPSSTTTYPPPPPELPSAALTPHTPAMPSAALTPHTPAGPEILEQDDSSDTQNLQRPLAPGPPTPASATRS